MKPNDLVNTLLDEVELSATKKKQIAALQRKADSADVTPGSVDHKVLLKRIKHLKQGGTRRWESVEGRRDIKGQLIDPAGDGARAARRDSVPARTVTVVHYELGDGMQGSYAVGADPASAKKMVKAQYPGERVSFGTVLPLDRYLSYMELESEDVPVPSEGEMIQLEAGT